MGVLTSSTWVAGRCPSVSTPLGSISRGPTNRRRSACCRVTPLHTHLPHHHCWPICLAARAQQQMLLERQSQQSDIVLSERQVGLQRGCGIRKIYCWSCPIFLAVGVLTPLEHCRGREESLTAGFGEDLARRPNPRHKLCPQILPLTILCYTLCVQVLRQTGNVLLLDEPTNDLDVDTLRALEQALLNFAGRPDELPDT